MQWDWSTVLGVQVLIWSIVLFEWKRLKKAKMSDRIPFAVILMISAVLSFFNLENLPGPLTLIHYIFGPLGRWMD